MTVTSGLAVANFLLETSAVFALFQLLALLNGPRVRVLLFRCAFVVALAAPLAFLKAAKLHIVTLPVQGTPASAALEGSQDALLSLTGALELRASTISAANVLEFVWVMGALVAAGKYFVSLTALHRAFKAGRKPTIGVEDQARALARRLSIRAPVALRVSHHVRAPCTFGWLRPTVLIPATLEREPLDTILAHELSHIRNSDALWLAIGRLSCAIHWFNPLVWLLAARHRDAIELVADDLAAHAGSGVAHYARSLIKIAGQLIDTPNAPAGAMISERGFGARMRILMNRKVPMPKPSPIIKTFAGAVSCLAIATICNVSFVSAEEVTLGAPRPGYGTLYLRVAAGVRVDVEEIGASCWDKADCQFEVAVGAKLLLHGTSTRDHGLEWSGCEPVNDGSTCSVSMMSQGAARVSVTTR